MGECMRQRGKVAKDVEPKVRARARVKAVAKPARRGRPPGSGARQRAAVQAALGLIESQARQIAIAAGKPSSVCASGFRA